MKRAPIVIATTIAGLVGVLTFHTKSAPLTVDLSSGGGTTTTGPGSTSTSSSSTGGSSSSSTSSSSPATTLPVSSSTTAPRSVTSPSTTTTSPTSTRSGTRTATGEAVNYSYGVLSVSVTAQGGKITNVQIASLDDGGNFRSQSIDQQSIPILEQEAIQAQSANIQSVSGASYTSAGFEQSLQSALTKLGIK